VKKPSILVLAAIAASLLIPEVASAHHSMSMYDRDHLVALNATIVTFDWTNPHLQIAFEGTDNQGKVQQWVAEGPGPIRLSTRGWSKESLKPGDHVVIYGNANKDGSPTMRFVKIAFPDGHELEAGYGHN
jgi:hypothetical protein